jgi:heterodisulfide reductase subunit C
MVTFFESYERELEKYWTKRSSSNSAEEYRRYLIRVMRTGAGGTSLHDEVWQCRKQMTCDVRHGSIKRVASAVGEGSIAIGACASIPG